MWTDALLTYLVHSSLLLGGVWLLTTCVHSMPAAWRESLWRVALLGGVVSAGAQIALDYEPFGGHVVLPSSAVVEDAREEPREESRTPGERVLTDVAPVALTEFSPGPSSAPAGDPTAASAAGRRMPPLALLALSWSLVVAALTLRRWRGRRQLARRIERRRLLVDGPLRETLNRLCVQAGFTRPLRLSEVTDLGSPIAFGTHRPEIVVPVRARTELSPAQQEAMLAHELAHHVRRDPGWLRGYAWVSGLFFFQPLNLLAQRRLGQAAELLADECAVSWTGRTRELAECLTAVARWAVYGSVPVTASAMAQPGSMLELRVATLLQRRATAGPTRRGVRLLAVLPLVLVAVFAPAVTSRAAVSHEPAAPEATSLMPRHEPASDVAEAMRLLDEEIAALEAEMTPLIDMLEQLEEAPPALTRGVGRLRSHLAALVNQRNVLGLEARTSLEKNR